MKTSLIILTRNEIEGVKALINKIPFSSVNEAIVIDYKSYDGTKEFFQSKKIRVVEQKNPGRAQAFKIGAKIAKGEHLIFFSPDGNEDPKDIVKIKNYLNSGFDMVIASRFMKGSRNEEDDKIFKFRAWANRIFTLLVKIFWGGNLTDSINGYRGITKEAFNKMRIDAIGFVVEYQMSIRAIKLGLKIKEFSTQEGDRIGGQSYSKAIPTGLLFVKYLIKELLTGKNF